MGTHVSLSYHVSETLDFHLEYLRIFAKKKSNTRNITKNGASTHHPPSATRKTRVFATGELFPGKTPEQFYHTVDGSELQKNHLGCMKPCISTGAGFLPSTVVLPMFIPLFHFSTLGGETAFDFLNPSTTFLPCNPSLKTLIRGKCAR